MLNIMEKIKLVLKKMFEHYKFSRILLTYLVLLLTGNYELNR